MSQRTVPGGSFEQREYGRAPVPRPRWLIPAILGLIALFVIGWLVSRMDDRTEVRPTPATEYQNR